MQYTEWQTRIPTASVFPFSLRDTLNCGQCFRFSETADGAFHGVAFGRTLTVRQDTLALYADCAPDEWDATWAPYFDLCTDYKPALEACSHHPVLRQASRSAGGIRILRQDPWETLCSFILSQNNNIPRIRGIISRLCETFGDFLPGGDFSFPSAQKIAGCSEADLAPLRCGFRWKYIADAADRVASGSLSLDDIFSLPLEEAEQRLISIKGVGPKVADCTLLFGFHQLEAFPRDVWIKRIMAQYFPDGLPPETAPFQGVVQQYLFHWARNNAALTECGTNGATPQKGNTAKAPVRI